MKLSENQKYAIQEFINDNKEEMISVWKELVELQSFSKEIDGVLAVSNRIKELFTKAGLKCETIEVGENAPSLVGILGDDRSDTPIIFGGHYDTVFPKDSFGQSFNIKDGKAFGPGALDMKGGIVIALYVIKALEKLNYKEHPLKIIFSGDEEIGHKNSSGGETIMKAAKGGLMAFNMETGLIDNSLCIGRKGSITLNLTVKGRASHAGNDFLAGRNAIEEMAHKLIALQALTNLELGTTVNCGVIKGGTVSNAVPAECSLDINIRILKMSEHERIMKEIENIANTFKVPDCSATLKEGHIMPLFETTEAGKKMYEFVCNVAKENNMPVPGAKVLGGSSDASFLTMAGVPTICSFGVMGEHNHTRNEYALVDTMFQRLEFITAIILSTYK